MTPLSVATPVSVLTLVRDREPHLHQLIEGLRRSTVAPAELIVVDMSGVPAMLPDTPFPIRVVRLVGETLPLAAARNQAAAAAASPHLLFLDVDCIPLGGCLAQLGASLDREDALLCADVRYLSAGAAAPGWDEAGLLAAGRPHPVRAFPDGGTRRETDYGLFWSLAFAIRRTTFDAIGGFDEGFVGYGGEDTDFGFRAERLELPMLFVGGAIACHQHHVSHEPPVGHLDDILRNAIRFESIWKRWPMAGWLAGFEARGLIAWSAGRPVRIRPTTPHDLAATRLP